MPKLKISPEEVPFRAVFFLEAIQWAVGAFVYNEEYEIEYSTIVLVPFVLGCAVMSLIDSTLNGTLYHGVLFFSANFSVAMLITVIWQILGIYHGFTEILIPMVTVTSVAEVIIILTIADSWRKGEWKLHDKSPKVKSHPKMDEFFDHLTSMFYSIVNLYGPLTATNVIISIARGDWLTFVFDLGTFTLSTITMRLMTIGVRLQSNILMNLSYALSLILMVSLPFRVLGDTISPDKLFSVIILGMTVYSGFVGRQCQTLFDKNLKIN
ncbi:6275_t:CDS:2 [Paraglomus occultum]|uniref:6275_t:CDS:1 n=1 Tax=Paraglomus occultum TaxID=144539 RepID=A0A9N9FCV0_9GLOM|nr:6275_t:CDS:2 [Paraglomus occultum]